MKKNIFLNLVLLSLFSFSALAQEPSANRLTIELIFPKQSSAPMTAPKPKLEPQKVSSRVVLDITPAPSKIEKDRYSVEYFLDEQLIYQTSGFDEKNYTQDSFSFIFDTTGYENGLHKLIVNFWDKSGPSAIGIREIIINNHTESADE